MDQHSLNKIDNLTETKPKMTSSDLKQLIIFGILYLITGIPIGLITGVHLLLAANYATKSMQASLALCRIPLGFKLLFATFVDSFYLTSFGRRKTYVMPGIYIIGMTLFTLGYCDIENWINLLEITPILILMLFAILIDGITIIAINGWALTAITQQFVHLSGTSLMIGQNFGRLLGYTIMCNLTSDYFSKNILGLSEHIIGLNAYLIILGLFTITLGILIQITCKEQSIETDSLLTQPQQFIYNLKRLHIVLKNKNVQFFILFLLSRRIPYAASTASFSIDLVQQGFPQSQYSLLSLFSYVSILFGAFILGKYMKKGTEMTWTFNTYYGLYLGSLIKVTFISTLKYMGGYNNQTFFLLVLIHVIGDLPNYLQDTSLSCFFMSISDPAIGATYTALLICAFELGYALSETLSLLLLNYIPYLYLAFGGFLLGIIYLYFLHKPLINLQKLEPESWKVEEIM